MVRPRRSQSQPNPTGSPDEFTSPTYGRMSFDQMFQRVIEFVADEPDWEYNLIIGTDSLHGEDTSFVTAIVVHRIGKGGRYFYRKFFERKMESLRQRIFYETAMSLEVANRVATALEEQGHTDLPVEIHLDVGEAGETRRVIKEVVGMVTGSGYTARVKPDAYGASKIADKHSK